MATLDCIEMGDNHLRYRLMSALSRRCNRCVVMALLLIALVVTTSGCSVSHRHDYKYIGKDSGVLQIEFVEQEASIAIDDTLTLKVTIKNLDSTGVDIPVASGIFQLTEIIEEFLVEPSITLRNFTPADSIYYLRIPPRQSLTLDLSFTPIVNLYPTTTDVSLWYHVFSERSGNRVEYSITAINRLRLQISKASPTL